MAAQLKGANLTIWHDAWRAMSASAPYAPEPLPEWRVGLPAAPEGRAELEIGRGLAKARAPERRRPEACRGEELLLSSAFFPSFVPTTFFVRPLLRPSSLRHVEVSRSMRPLLPFIARQMVQSEACSSSATEQVTRSICSVISMEALAILLKTRDTMLSNFLISASLL